MEVDQYNISNNPEGYRIIYVLKDDLPSRFHVEGNLTRRQGSLTISPQGDGLAMQIISGIEERGFYLSKANPSNKINFIEHTRSLT